ncbi:MAG: hypothetical protein ACOYKA_03630 [Legionellaceae bacterium]
MDTSIDTTVAKQETKSFSPCIKLCMAAAAHADFQIKTSRNDDTYTQPTGALKISDYFSHPGDITLDLSDLTDLQKQYFYREVPHAVPNLSVVIQEKPKVSLIFHDVIREPLKKVESTLTFSSLAPEESSSESSHTEENDTEEEQDDIDNLRYQIDLLTEKKVLAPVKTGGIHIKISSLQVEKVIQSYEQIKHNNDEQNIDLLLQSYPSTAIRTKISQKSMNDHYLSFLKDISVDALRLIFKQESEYAKFTTRLINIQTWINTKSLSKSSPELTLLDTILETDDAILKLKAIINHGIQVLKRRAEVELKELIEPETAPAVFRDATKIVQAYKKTDPHESLPTHKKLKSLLLELKTIHKTFKDASATQNNTFEHLTRARSIEFELTKLVYTAENKIILQLLDEISQFKQPQVKIEQAPIQVPATSIAQQISEPPVQQDIAITQKNSTQNIEPYNPTFILHCLSSPKAFKIYGAIMMIASLMVMGCVAGGVLPLLLGATVASTGMLLGAGCFFIPNHVKKFKTTPTLDNSMMSLDVAPSSPA